MKQTLIRILIVTFFISSNVVGAQSSTQKRRIITAGSAITEIVCALGYENEIIATDRTSVFPKEMSQLPSIGYRNGINAENIIAQAPDLILAEKGYVKQEVITQLSLTQLEFHALIDPLSFKETKTLIRDIGRILEANAKAEGLIRKMEREWQILQDKLAKTKSKPKVIFVLSHNQGTQMIAGSATFADQLFKMANAQNAVPAIKGYKPLNAEAMIVANPDFLLFGNKAFNALGKNEGALKIVGVAQTEAGKKDQFVSLDLVMISNFGPRLIQAADALANAIHPELKQDLSQNE